MPKKQYKSEPTYINIEALERQAVLRELLDTPENLAEMRAEKEKLAKELSTIKETIVREFESQRQDAVDGIANSLKSYEDDKARLIEEIAILNTTSGQIDTENEVARNELQGYNSASSFIKQEIKDATASLADIQSAKFKERVKLDKEWEKITEQSRKIDLKCADLDERGDKLQEKELELNRRDRVANTESGDLEKKKESIFKMEELSSVNAKNHDAKVSEDSRVLKTWSEKLTGKDQSLAQLAQELGTLKASLEKREKRVKHGEESLAINQKAYAKEKNKIAWNARNED